MGAPIASLLLDYALIRGSDTLHQAESVCLLGRVYVFDRGCDAEPRRQTFAGLRGHRFEVLSVRVLTTLTATMPDRLYSFKNGTFLRAGRELSTAEAACSTVAIEW